MLREIDNDGNWAITTTDKIISEDKNHFKGWYCSAGAKGLYIDHDGNIWKGLCLVRQLIDLIIQDGVLI